ncbi:MAG: hypothetical protein ACI4XL_11885 [Bacillus sp. (in: firmicutes)]
MVWALAILLGAAVVLLIISFIISGKNSSQEEEANAYFASTMKEINQIQEKTRNIELDLEILAQATGMNNEQRVLQRQLLDLYKRKYSLETISLKLNVHRDDVEKMLAPYKKESAVRGTD